MPQYEITPFGQDALKQRSVTGRERQVIVLAIGKSSSQRMLQAMGAESQAILQRLLALGILREKGMASADAVFADSMHAMSEDTRVGLSIFGDDPFFQSQLDLLPPAPPPTPAEEEAHSALDLELTFPETQPASTISLEQLAAISVQAPPHVEADTTGRRSLRASKFYIVSMLRLLEKPDAERMAQLLLQPMENEDEEIKLILFAAEFLGVSTKPDLALHIFNKLRTILPQHLLPALEVAAQGSVRTNDVLL